MRYAERHAAIVSNECCGLPSNTFERRALLAFLFGRSTPTATTSTPLDLLSADAASKSCEGLLPLPLRTHAVCIRSVAKVLNPVLGSRYLCVDMKSAAAKNRSTGLGIRHGEHMTCER